MERILFSIVTGLLLVAAAGAQVIPVEQQARIFDYDAKAPLDVKERTVEEVEGVQIRDITYASPKGGQVTAYLVTPKGKGPFAGILFMHWGQGDRTEFLSEAVAYAKAGAVSLMIDAPYNRPGFQGGDFFVQPEREHDMYIQLVVDLRRGFDLLLARADVDPKRLGYVGHSLGATWGGALAGVDHRATAFVLMGGLPSLTDFPEDDTYAQFILRRYSKEQVENYIRVISPINPEHFVWQAVPGAILFQFAKHDRYISERSAARYDKAASQPQESRRYFTSHEFNDLEALRERAEWLRMKLGLGPVLPQLKLAPPPTACGGS